LLILMQRMVGYTTYCSRLGRVRDLKPTQSFYPLSFPTCGRWPKAQWGFQERFHACWHASAGRLG
jgi:hypothetical protein